VQKRVPQDNARAEHIHGNEAATRGELLQVFEEQAEAIMVTHTDIHEHLTSERARLRKEMAAQERRLQAKALEQQHELEQVKTRLAAAERLNQQTKREMYMARRETEKERAKNQKAEEEQKSQRWSEPQPTPFWKAAFTLKG
jgi:hypothetical protein